MVRLYRRSAGYHGERSLDDRRLDLDEHLATTKSMTMDARWHTGWSTPAGARKTAAAAASRRSRRRALRWPAPAKPRAESGTAACEAERGSRGGRPRRRATTGAHHHACRYARWAGDGAVLTVPLLGRGEVLTLLVLHRDRQSVRGLVQERLVIRRHVVLHRVRVLGNHRRAAGGRTLLQQRPGGVARSAEWLPGWVVRVTACRPSRSASRSSSAASRRAAPCCAGRCSVRGCSAW